MPEFLKHLIALGMVSIISLSRGYDAQAPAGTLSEADAVVTPVDEGEMLSAQVAMDGNSTQSPDKLGVRTGVTVVQSSPDPPTIEGAPTSAASSLQAHLDVTAQNPTAAHNALLAAPAPETTCRPIQTQAYGSLAIRGGASAHPATEQADLNLGLRAWKSVNAPLALQSIGGPTDGNAPRFPSLFAPARVPRMTGAYQVYNWDFHSGRRAAPITSPAVTLVAFATAQGEPILLPGSGYSIGDGYAALVLYAEPTRVTLKYTREDNVAVGYTLHLENLCLEPHLLALYRYLNGAGRRQLPALRNGQALGTANGSQILAGIQDSGAWMDPRSRKDWW